MIVGVGTIGKEGIIYMQGGGKQTKKNVRLNGGGGGGGGGILVGHTHEGRGGEGW